MQAPEGGEGRWSSSGLTTSTCSIRWCPRTPPGASTQSQLPRLRPPVLLRMTAISLAVPSDVRTFFVFLLFWPFPAIRPATTVVALSGRADPVFVSAIRSYKASLSLNNPLCKAQPCSAQPAHPASPTAPKPDSLSLFCFGLPDRQIPSDLESWTFPSSEN